MYAVVLVIFLNELNLCVTVLMIDVPMLVFLTETVILGF